MKSYNSDIEVDTREINTTDWEGQGVQKLDKEHGNTLTY